MEAFVLLAILCVLWYVWYLRKRSSPLGKQNVPSQSISSVKKAKPHNHHNYSPSRKIYDENEIYERSLQDDEPDWQRLNEIKQERDAEWESLEETYTYDPD